MKAISLIAVICLSAAGASAQSLNTASIAASSKGFEGGYGGAQQMVSGNFNPSTRDANNNRIVQDGLIQTGMGGSQFLSGMMGGAATAQSGAITSTNYAVGNLINVQVAGSWNTVVLNTTQINNGAVTAISSINGGTLTSTGQLN